MMINYVVVDFPVRLANLARRVEQALQAVLQDPRGTERHAATLDSLGHCVDHVGALLEDVRPDEVQQVHQRVLAAESRHAQRLRV